MSQAMLCLTRACLEELWRGVRITPLLQLLVGVDHHAAPHPRHRKQLHVVAAVTANHHTILRLIARLLDLRSAFPMNSCTSRMPMQALQAHQQELRHPLFRSACIMLSPKPHYSKSSLQ